MTMPSGSGWTASATDGSLVTGSLLTLGEMNYASPRGALFMPPHVLWQLNCRQGVAGPYPDLPCRLDSGTRTSGRVRRTRGLGEYQSLGPARAGASPPLGIHLLRPSGVQRTQRVRRDAGTSRKQHVDSTR